MTDSRAKRTAESPAAQVNSAENKEVRSPIPTDAAQEVIDPVPVPETSFIFPLALTILAIFPLALGVGLVRARLATQTATLNHNTITQEKSEKSQPKSQPLDRRLGDKDFIDRRYEVALRYYSSLAGDHSLALPAEIEYRIGLCHEALGHWDQAREIFQALAIDSDRSLLRAAAIMGQVRIAFRYQEPRRATLLLRSLCFRSPAQTELPLNMVREIAFLLPLALAEDLTHSANDAMQEQFGDLGPLLTWSLEVALSWAETAEVTPETEPQTVDATRPVNRPCLNVVSHQGSDPEFPPLLLAELSGDQMTARRVLEEIATTLGLSLNLRGVSNEPSLDLPINLKFAQSPLPMILTSLCSASKFTWQINDNQLNINLVGNSRESQFSMLNQTLESLNQWIPNHRFVSHSRFAIAQLAQMQDETASAIDHFAAAIGQDSTPLAIQSAYNAACLHEKSGRHTRAIYYFDKIVSGAPGHTLHGVALLHMGRLMLDVGQTQEAVFQLRRGTESTMAKDVRARAAVLLGFAYLAQDKFKEAGEAILVNRAFFDEPEVRNAAAFVTTFARSQVVTGVELERESTFIYRSLMAIKQDEQLLSQTGLTMVGRAYFDVGLTDEMVEVYQKLLSSQITDAIKAEIRYSLANFEFSQGLKSKAMEDWTQLATGTKGRWSNRARFRIAETALHDGRASECLQSCRLIDSSYEGIVRADLQKLMGRAFEQLGDRDNAIRCYAGQQPQL